MTPKDEFVGGSSKQEFCLRDTMAVRSSDEKDDLQSWLDGEEVQEVPFGLHEEVEKYAPA